MSDLSNFFNQLSETYRNASEQFKNSSEYKSIQDAGKKLRDSKLMNLPEEEKQIIRENLDRFLK